MVTSLAPLLIVMTTVAVPAQEVALADRLATRFEALAGEGRFSGELRVSRGDRLIVHRGFGGVAVAPERPGVYLVGSITKTFTATATLLLVQQGRLRLDDPLSKHFPELDSARLARAGRAVTLDDLLTQTSGLSGMGPLRPLWGSDHTPEAVARMLAEEARLETTPGQAYRYCNECYEVLGEVIRRVSGTSYDRFVVENVSRPLGLVDTGIVLGAGPRGRVWPGQVGTLLGLRDSRRLMPHRLGGAFQWPGGAAGAIRSTAADVERLFQALAAGKLIGPELRDQMFTGKLEEYGRGVVVQPLASGRKLVWHNGGLYPLGYQAFAGMVFDPSAEGAPLTLVVLANADESALDLTDEVLAALARQPPPAFPRWTVSRTMYTLKALWLGPLLAAGALVALLWRRRRPATARARTLTLASLVLAVVAVGLSDLQTPVFAGGLALVVIAGAADLRRTPPPGTSAERGAGGAALVSLLLVLPVVAFVVLVRWLVL